MPQAGFGGLILNHERDMDQNLQSKTIIVLGIKWGHKSIRIGYVVYL